MKVNKYIFEVGNMNEQKLSGDERKKKGEKEFKITSQTRERKQTKKHIGRKQRKN